MPDQPLDSLLEVDGVQESTLEALQEAGFGALDELALATQNDLRGIGNLDTYTVVNILHFLEREGYREPREVTENQQKLQQLLRDLFQFDAADLDFGIYRILNQRRDIIEDFLEEDLIRAVHGALDEVATEERAELQEEVSDARAEIVDQLNEDVFTPEGDIKEEFREFGVAQDYIAAKERLEQYEVAEETEARIFNDLHRFFSRFYDRGDFHTKRRFSSQDAKFMVPYNGEEVFFHWANRDQYYVKTSEHFTTYRFDADDLSVEFTVEDANVPQDNVKGDERYFILGTDPVSWDEEKQKLTITFQYRLISEDEEDTFLDTYNEVTGDGRKRFSGKKNTIICTALHHDILDLLEASVPREALQQEEDGETVLMHHLTRYTSENTMDYFVHKDLGGFLMDELDYYIQNEILDTDELINADADREPNSLLRARVVRQIADRIITFLDQIESFQKRLFEKRKFITQTDYMVTLDKVPDRLYDDILENEDQLDQWHDVYNIDEWRGDLSWQGEFTEEVLEDNPHLMIDTALFDEDFKHELLASFDDIEREIDGVLVHGENYQALNLLLEKYRNQIDCCYIDPPYNTGNDGFLYKDRYQHSTWLSLLHDRLSALHSMLPDESSVFISNDDNENNRLTTLLNQIFGESNFVANVIWQKVYSPKNSAQYFSEDHDYITVFSKNKEEWRPNLLPRSEEQDKRYQNPDDDPRDSWKPSDLTARNPYSEGQYEVESPSGKTFSPPTGRYWSISKEKFEQLDDDNRIWWGEDGNNMPHLKRFLSEVQEGMVPQTLWQYEEVGHTQAAKKELLDFVDFDRTEDVLNTVKPSSLIKRILRIGTDDSLPSFVLDFFAGSGPTAHAAIDLNREEKSNRRYILVELADYFDSIIRPRIQRVVLSSTWNDGKPEDRENGITQLVKYHRIESYEDALNNVILEGPDDEAQQRLVEEKREEYVSGYMLDFEGRGPSLMEPVSFEHPFEFELEIERNGTSGEPVTVDLVETFHYLIGANYHGFEACEHQDRKYVVTRCSVEKEDSVDSVLTVWRDTDDLDLEQERDWFADQFEAGRFDRIYINSESFVPSAEPVEVTFKELMEAGHDGAE